MISLTSRAQQMIAASLREGDVAVDATAGNGHDTVFLARCVGASGHVYAIDVQKKALEATHQRVVDERLEDRVTLFQGSHADWSLILKPQHHHGVRSVMMNLGYLPGSDRTVITRSDSTLRAIDESIQHLTPGGVLTVVAYTGHDGGWEEAVGVEAALVDGLKKGAWRSLEATPKQLERGKPTLFIARRSDGVWRNGSTS